MRAQVIRSIGPLTNGRPPLSFESVPTPEPADGEVRLRVAACGVCHTDLDEVEGRLPPSTLPRIPGHQVVGVVDAVGGGVDAGLVGQRVGVAWIGGACGSCARCLAGVENLCDNFIGTGHAVDGGYAEWMVARAAFVTPVPRALSDADAAPLLCAGAVGMRALSLARVPDGAPLALTGFGASGHLVLRMAHVRHPTSPIFVFARSPAERAFARDLGAAWTGDTDEAPPVAPAAIIDTTPVWHTVLRALEYLAPGGRLIINAIRKEDGDRAELAALDYPRHLWREKTLQSVANVTRADVRACLDLAARHDIRPSVTARPLAEAGDALLEIKRGHLRGATVLICAS